MKARCKECGAINEKGATEHSVECSSCGAVTFYFIYPQTREGS